LSKAEHQLRQKVVPISNKRSRRALVAHVKY